MCVVYEYLWYIFAFEHIQLDLHISFSPSSRDEHLTICIFEGRGTHKFTTFQYISHFSSEIAPFLTVAVQSAASFLVVVLLLALVCLVFFCFPG